MAISNPFSSDASASTSSSASVKRAIVEQVQSEAAMNNARALIDRIRSNCFEKCIASPPASTLSGKDQACLTTCMEKYISFWNSTNRAYIARLGREQEHAGSNAALMSSGVGGPGSL